jgi:aspartate 1-decarboxylase
MRVFLRSKIHNATVTDANLNYVGSMTVAVSAVCAPPAVV